jgi:hypothetical protein
VVGPEYEIKSIIGTILANANDALIGFLYLLYPGLSLESSNIFLKLVHL